MVRLRIKSVMTVIPNNKLKIITCCYVSFKNTLMWESALLLWYNPFWTFPSKPFSSINQSARKSPLGHYFLKTALEIFVSISPSQKIINPSFKTKLLEKALPNFPVTINLFEKKIKNLFRQRFWKLLLNVHLLIRSSEKTTPILKTLLGNSPSDFKL